MTFESMAGILLPIITLTTITTIRALRTNALVHYILITNYKLEDFNFWNSVYMQIEFIEKRSQTNDTKNIRH